MLPFCRREETKFARKLGNGGKLGRQHNPPFYNLFTPETTTTGNNEIKGKKQPDSFWASFPRRELPKKPTTRVNIKNLEALVNKHKAKWIQEDIVKANTAETIAGLH
jgi:hypothetical protein